MVSIAIHAGLPAVAARHGFAALKDFSKQSYVKDVSVLCNRGLVIGLARKLVTIFQPIVLSRIVY